MSRQPAIAGILFDKDGTLLDFDASWGPVNRRVADFAAEGNPDLAANLLHVCGMDPVTGAIRPDSMFAAGNTRDIAEAMASGGSVIPLEELVARIDDFFAEAAQFSVAITQLLPLFERLSARGLRLGIASSDNERSIRITAERFGILPFLDYVAGYDSGHGPKPEAGMVLGFCKSTGLNPEQVAVVGDNNHDLLMGKAAGAGLKVGVLSGTGTRDTLGRHSDVILADITQIEAVLC